MSKRRSTMGFASGLISGGLDTYFNMKRLERAEARDKRDQETHDALQEQRQRELTTQRNTDAAIREYAGVVTDGVTEQNTSGLSNPSAAMLHNQGGQALVDETASYANLENRRMGLAPSYATSGASGEPTVTRREATPIDRATAYEKMAIAKGDLAGIKEASEAKQKAIWAESDAKAAKAVIDNPNGPEAQQLAALIRQSVPGAEFDLDTKTGMYVGTIANQPVKLTPIEFGQLAVANNKWQRGDYSGLSDLAAIDKNLAGIVAGTLKTNIELAKFNNEAGAAGANIQDRNIRTGLAVNADTRAGQAHGVEMSGKAADMANKVAEAQVRVAELLRKNPNASPAEIAAARTGQADPFKATDDRNAPSEVKLAQAYMRAGLAPDLAAGLKLATQSKDYSPEKVRADIYGKALAASYGHSDIAQQATDQAMSYLFPDASPKPSGATGALPAKDKLVKGQTYDIPDRGPMRWTGTGFVK